MVCNKCNIELIETFANNLEIDGGGLGWLEEKPHHWGIKFFYCPECGNVEITMD